MHQSRKMLILILIEISDWKLSFINSSHDLIPQNQHRSYTQPTIAKAPPRSRQMGVELFSKE